MQNLEEDGWQADYIITRYALAGIARIESCHSEVDRLTDCSQEVYERSDYRYWLFGYYLDNRIIDVKYIQLWGQIVQVLYEI